MRLLFHTRVSHSRLTLAPVYILEIETDYTRQERDSSRTSIARSRLDTRRLHRWTSVRMIPFMFYIFETQTHRQSTISIPDSATVSTQLRCRKFYHAGFLILFSWVVWKSNIHTLDVRTCVSHLRLALASDTCVWHLRLALASGTCVWHSTFSLASDTRRSHLRLTLDVLTCVWHSNRNASNEMRHATTRESNFVSPVALVYYFRK
jgi:hypothetical protein